MLTIQAFANHVWQSTLFAVGTALVITALRKNSAEVRYRLWLIASAKFVLPLSFFIELGSRLRSVVPARIAPSTVPVGFQQLSQPFSIPTLTDSLPQVASSPAAISLVQILFGVWVCGVLVILISWTRQWLQLRTLLRTAEPLPMEAPIRVVSCESRMEPGVFGIVRPVLILPVKIRTQLAPAHVETILAHELCHVRRHDNLAAAFHMLVEALFWFHPLVWWIGSRLVEEREQACDEEVLRLGNLPAVYAESILKTCQFFLETPLACMSGVTGSDLKKRIVRIMTQGMAVRLNTPKKLLLAAAAVAAVALPLCIGLGAAPKIDAQPAEFEVASIKPGDPNSMGMMFNIGPGAHMVATNTTVQAILEMAYDVKDAQIADAPAWLNSQRFTIDAKPDEATGAALDKLPPDQRAPAVRRMLQSLLADRFKLSLGHSHKELPVYALVVAKSGPKFHQSTGVVPDRPHDAGEPGNGGAPPPGSIMMNGRGQMTITAVELRQFAEGLSHATGRVVIDKTGLTGRYDFSLSWTPEEGEGPMMAGSPPNSAGASPHSETSGPSIFTAVQEQLGLKLEPEKELVDVLVIQHVEKPSEN